MVLKSFIHGEAIESDASLLPVINPATGKKAYMMQTASEKVLELAVESAHKGFNIWSNTSPSERQQVLQRTAVLLRERCQKLAKIEVTDTGKPLQEAISVDVPSSAEVFEYYAGLTRVLEGTQHNLGNDFFYTRREPLGICAAIGAWNYPLQIACWKAAPALACGNAMIFKPSEETPRGAIELAQILIEAGLPEGVFNIVLGAGSEGEWLSTHEDINKVSFTGSVKTGLRVMASAAKTLKPVTMELGGKSPLIIFEDADIDEAVSAAMVGNFFTQGEVCTNGTRVFVQQGIYQDFIDRLLERMHNNIIIGNPMDLQTNIGSLISEQHRQKVLSYVNSGVAEGARLIFGGTACSPDSAPTGFFIKPAIFTDCQDHMTICKEEIFGPVMSVLTFTDENEAIRRANNTELGLAAGVYTCDLRKAHRVIHQLQAGICWINSYGLSPVSMPAGGYKKSGIGRENGLETLHQYTQTKSVYVGMIPIESPF